ncbi:MAG: hypothetical protein ACKKL4_01840 [Patescibacteria group bacterium]
MRSALIVIMVSAGWRLGYPIAFVIEESNQQGIFLSSALVGYIVGADHARVLFHDKHYGSRHEVILPSTKRVHIHSQKEWEIPLAGGQTMFIGQSIPFIRRVGYWAQELQAQKALAVAPSVGNA